MVTKRFLATGTITDTLVDGDGPHGVACAEVIHDIAPEAQLYLIQSTSLEINLEDIFSYLHSEGVKVASMSLAVFPQWRGRWSRADPT